MFRRRFLWVMVTMTDGENETKSESRFVRVPFAGNGRQLNGNARARIALRVYGTSLANATEPTEAGGAAVAAWLPSRCALRRTAAAAAAASLSAAIILLLCVCYYAV